MLAELGGPGSRATAEALAAWSSSTASGSGPLTAFDALWDLGAAVDDAEIDAAQARGQHRTTSPTSSTPRAPPRRRRASSSRHGGLIENMWNIGERQHLTPADRMWMGISLFWSFGCANALLAVMTHGGTIVLQESLEPGGALALIERERCTVYYGTPNIALALTEHPDRARRDLRSLRTGAAIGPPPAMQMVMDLGVREICNVYGLTETYGNCAVTDAHDPPDIRRTTVGLPAAGDGDPHRRPRDAPAAAAGRGRRDPRARLPDAGLLQGSGEERRGLRRRRIPRDRRPRRSSTTTGGSASAAASRRWSRPAGSTWRRSRSRKSCSAIRPSSRPTSSGSPIARQGGDPRRGRRPRDGHAAEPEALRAFCKQALAAFKVPQEFRVLMRATSCPSPPPARCRSSAWPRCSARSATPRRMKPPDPDERLAAQRLGPHPDRLRGRSSASSSSRRSCPSTSASWA